MTQNLFSEQVWTELKKEIFAVLGMVTARGESRTVGIVYIVRNHYICLSMGKLYWKAHHVRNNPHGSLAVPIG